LFKLDDETIEDLIVRLRSLHDHTFKQLIKLSISVRDGVWGFILEFEGTSGAPQASSQPRSLPLPLPLAAP
jgi:hypothetical protein